MELWQSLLIESWTLYVLGVLGTACRLVARRIKLGKWSSLAIDDYLMCFALVCFTGVVVSINEVAQNGSNYMSAAAAAALTPAGVRQAIYGSKMTFVLEIFTLTALWTIKACLLILYRRLTKGTKSLQAWGVKIVAGYCCITYILTILLFVFYWCSPNTYEYWAVPVRIEQCATYYNHLVFATACNISSDLMLFCIPIPIIIRTTLPMKRKIILCCILGLGVFNILASILNRYYNFSNPNELIFLYWYVAEVGVAMLVGNLPLCWPLVRLALGHTDNTGTPSYDHFQSSDRNGYQRKPRSHGVTWAMMEDDDEIVGKSAPRGSDTGSQIELVHGANQGRGSPNGTSSGAKSEASRGGYHHHGQSQDQNGDKIMVVTTVDVSSQ